MFFGILQWHRFDVILNRYHITIDLGYHLSLNHFVEPLMKAQFTYLASVWIFCHKVNWIILASDLVLFNHLVGLTVDYENAPTNCCCRYTMLILYHESCDEGMIFYEFPFLFIFNEYLYVSYFVRRVVSRIGKVLRRPWYIILELKNSFKFIELLISINWLPRV